MNIEVYKQIQALINIFFCAIILSNFEFYNNIKSVEHKLLFASIVFLIFTFSFDFVLSKFVSYIYDFIKKKEKK